MTGEEKTKGGKEKMTKKPEGLTMSECNLSCACELIQNNELEEIGRVRRQAVDAVYATLGKELPKKFQTVFMISSILYECKERVSDLSVNLQGEELM